MLIFGFLALFLIIAFQGVIRNFISLNQQKLKIHKDNFFVYSNEEVIKRPRPLTTAKVDSALEVYIGRPFVNFSEEEWEEFWKIIYGVYPKDEPERPGLPRKLRQLTEEEIASELIARYPQPFRNFREEHWNEFFKIIRGD